MKKCSKCKEEKAHSEFYKNKARKDGLCNLCKKCDLSKKVDKEKARLRFERWRKSEKGIEYFTNYYIQNSEQYKARNSKWKKENPERMKELWRKTTKRSKWKELHKANSAKRRALKASSTISGYENELKEIYKNCPKGFHVDHIIPLVNDIVCGLHVPWNLQYLEASENLKKSNKIKDL